MSNNCITIVDYRCGNIYSNRIIEKFDYKVEIIDDPEKVSKADVLILPELVLQCRNGKSKK